MPTESRRTAPGASAHMGAFIADFPAADIPAAARDAALLSLLDTACAAALGADSDLGARLLATGDGDNRVRPAYGGGRIGVAGTAVRDTPVAAAFLFGALAHAYEIDDWAGYGAAGAPVWGALLALRQAEGIDDWRLLADAYCIGVEAAASLWQAGHFRQADHGLDGTGVFGTIASAVASARLLALDAERAIWAVAIAGSEFGGVIANLGTGAGTLHAGFAARNGLQAALLARAGFYGADDVLEARQGLGEACFGPTDGLLTGLPEIIGQPFKVASQLRFRHSPCAIDHQRPISALRGLLAGTGLRPGDIAEVGVSGVPPTSEGVRSYAPATAAEARGSLRYSLACTLAGVPMVPPPIASVERRAEVTSAMDKVRVEIVPRWEPRLLTDGAEATEVWIRTHAGQRLSADPRKQPLSLSREQLLGKWKTITAALEPGAYAVGFLSRVTGQWERWPGHPDEPGFPDILP